MSLAAAVVDMMKKITQLTMQQRRLFAAEQIRAKCGENRRLLRQPAGYLSLRERVKETSALDSILRHHLMKISYYEEKRKL